MKDQASASLSDLGFPDDSFSTTDDSDGSGQGMPPGFGGSTASAGHASLLGGSAGGRGGGARGGGIAAFGGKFASSTTGAALFGGGVSRGFVSQLQEQLSALLAENTRLQEQVKEDRRVSQNTVLEAQRKATAMVSQLQADTNDAQRAQGKG